MESFLKVPLFCLAFVAMFATRSLPAHFIDTVGTLNGPSAGTASTATGTARVQLDMDLVTMRVVIDFAGLNGNSVSANLFVPTPPSGAGSIVANVPSLLSFPTGVTSGTYDRTFDLTVAGSYNPRLLPLLVELCLTRLMRSMMPWTQVLLS